MIIQTAAVAMCCYCWVYYYPLAGLHVLQYRRPADLQGQFHRIQDVE
jgi:hypothetical protein